MEMDNKILKFIGNWKWPRIVTTIFRKRIRAQGLHYSISKKLKVY